MKRIPTRDYIMVLSLICVISGCQVREQNQVAVVEVNAIAHIQRDLKSYENNNPGVPVTNMLQLFLNTTNSPWGYPHKIEAQLRSVQQIPGFSNSIYERYVLIP